jgi:Outer membrane lipoprotein carrier protein LolA
MRLPLPFMQPTTSRDHMRRRSFLAAIVPLVACRSLPTQPAPDNDAEINRVEAYLNGIKTLQAHSVQVWPNGTTSDGTLWMDRPGRLRLQYAPPSPLTLIAAQGTLLIHNASNQATTTMPLARTPLSILLAPRHRPARVRHRHEYPKHPRRPHHNSGSHQRLARRLAHAVLVPRPAHASLDSRR